MCRYQPDQRRDHLACFTCRKAFRIASRIQQPQASREPPGQPRRATCPQCGQPMVDMGLDFRAPKQKNKKHWERLAWLARQGFVFEPCACCGPGYDLAEFEAIYDFVRGKMPRPEGEALVFNLLQRSKRRNTTEK